MPLKIFGKFATTLGMSFWKVLLNKIQETFLWVFQLWWPSCWLQLQPPLDIPRIRKNISKNIITIKVNYAWAPVALMKLNSKRCA